MTPAPAPPNVDKSAAPRSGRGLRWLRADEGWAPGEEVVRLLGAVAVALVAIAVKLLIVGVLGGELGYLSYVAAIALAGWFAGWRGGVITTAICAIGEAGLFSGSLGEFLAAPLTVLQFVVFLLVGLLVAWITSHLRQAMVHERAARAIGDRALEAQVAAYQVAERDRSALASLQAVTASLAGAATPEEVADAILDRGLMALGARAGVVNRLSDDGRVLDLLATRGYSVATATNQQRFDLATPSHMRDAVAGRSPLFLTDPAAWALRYPETAPVPLPDSPSGGSLAVLPLLSSGQVIGTVVFRFATPEELDPSKRDLALRLADQGAQALDRALAYDRERTAREALERSGVRLTFLAATSEQLASGVDIEKTASAIPRLAIPAVADWCAVRLLDDDLDLLAPAAGTPAAEEAVVRLATLAPEDLVPSPGMRQGQGGAEVGGTVITVPDGWSGRIRDPRVAGMLQGLETRSVLVAPIGDTPAEPIGWVIFGTADAGGYGPDDLAMAHELASRIAVAAERSRLFAAVTRFKATVDATEDAVYMFDPDTLRLTYVNRGGASLLGRDVSDLEGANMLDLQPASHEPAFRMRMADVRRAPGRSVPYTGVLTRRDGRETPVDARLQEVTQPDGTRTAILTARDISDRIAVQARLARIAGDERRKAAELRAVIQAMGEGILVVDPSGGISLANDAAATILGGDVPGALAGLEERLRPRASDAPEPPDSTDGEPGDGAGPRTVHVDDGRWLEVTVYPADLAGAVSDESSPSRIVVLRDVTRAREAEAAREAFLGVLSHELRTPVTTIFGWAKILQRPGHRPDTAELLADIEAEADRLYRIVEDLLALSRVEGGMRVEGEPLLVQHLAGSLVAAESRRSQGTTFEIDLPPDLPAVFGERTYVEQVLRNLVSNAIKYSPPGAVVTIEGEATQDELLIRVLDRGRGIEPEEADRLFDLYYRSSTTARMADGAGIGLYIGRGLVTAMGGRIWARPRPGGGSEFGFSLARCEDDLLTPIPDRP